MVATDLTRRTILAALAAAPFAGRAQAETDWPTRPVRVMVPYPPAGGADTTARILYGRGAPISASVGGSGQGVERDRAAVARVEIPRHRRRHVGDRGLLGGDAERRRTALDDDAGARGAGSAARGDHKRRRPAGPAQAGAGADQ